ncbi:c(7)-type cytochrome triheme domain-containing protein [Aromatoleum tolulyticum]|uniref:C(7)-type cytochrome triheme domain-containing protein n=2 Tax=Aromatoleum tolulyticum TaxID=34027 RepID=A0A1N6ZMP5_9RHOO|nr:c(7)-type cytochrome triheme domain-containing protein [Aromatoleum tolulyticum]
MNRCAVIMSVRLPRVPFTRCVKCLLVLMLVFARPSPADERVWAPLANDGLRDPRGPAVKILQQPGDALFPLSPDNAGNQVRWVNALKEGQINPRASLRKPLVSEKYDKDVLLNLNGGMPVVRFPHSIHNEWLDCSNCHDHLFKKQRGASKISMFLILQGEQCGVCHGAVAFPLTECARCHSVKRADALAELEREEAAKAAVPAPPPAPTSERTSAPRKEGKGK